MPILGTIASSRASAPTPVSAYFQIGFHQGSASSVTFSNIPQTYDHLEIWYYAKSGRSPNYDTLSFRANGVSTAGSHNYTAVQCDVRTSGPFPGYDFSGTAMAIGGIPGASSSNYYGAGITRIMNYSDTSRQKAVVAYGGYAGLNDGTTEQGLVYPIQGLFTSNNAITSINIFGATTLQANTQISLFGVKG